MSSEAAIPQKAVVNQWLKELYFRHQINSSFRIWPNVSEHVLSLFFGGHTLFWNVCCVKFVSWTLMCLAPLLVVCGARFGKSSAPVPGLVAAARRRQWLQFTGVWTGRGWRDAPRLSPVRAAPSRRAGHRHLRPHLRRGRGGRPVVRRNQPQNQAARHLSHRVRHRPQHSRRRSVSQTL